MQDKFLTSETWKFVKVAAPIFCVAQKICRSFLIFTLRISTRHIFRCDFYATYFNMSFYSIYFRRECLHNIFLCKFSTQHIFNKSFGSTYFWWKFRLNIFLISVFTQHIFSKNEKKFENKLLHIHPYIKIYYSIKINFWG